MSGRGEKMTGMRIYLPLTAPDRAVLETASPYLELPAGRSAWAVTAEARTDRPDTEEEELEYDALQDAVHVALTAAEPSARALVIAVDVEEQLVQPAGDSGGAFGIRLAATASARIASFHVTELDAAAAEADDTDPALLWFDVGESPEALAYLAGAVS